MFETLFVGLCALSDIMIHGSISRIEISAVVEIRESNQGWDSSELSFSLVPFLYFLFPHLGLYFRKKSFDYDCVLAGGTSKV